MQGVDEAIGADAAGKHGRVSPTHIWWMTGCSMISTVHFAHNGEIPENVLRLDCLDR
jgi:hypothetical protein